MAIETSNRTKIIVGVDYGTTYTGISWVESTASSLEGIRIIKTWPGPAKEADETWKTPSRIAYASDNKDSTSNQWGYLVTPKMKSYSWTKLLLDKSADITEFDDPDLKDLAKSQGDGLCKLPFHKTGTDVAGDYLWELYKYFIKTLEQRISPEILRLTPMEFWFTVPAMWSDTAKNATKQAALKAKFASRPGDKLYLITEPEAAAVAVLKSLTHEGTENQIKPGDGVLICDCGGGTVDITTYSIKQTYPNLEFEEMLVGAGGKCGSTYIDREFHKWMSKKFGSSFDNGVKFEKKGPGSKFMKEFESAKRDFGRSTDHDQEFECSLLIPGAKDSQYYESDECLVKIPKMDMLSFFRPVVDKIVKLLKDQIQRAEREAADCRVNTVLLVGGFGDSPYLLDVVKSWCKKNGNIRVLCPPHPQAAIVKGAALRGLEGIKPTKKRCRRHYGFRIANEFREGIDPPEDATYDEYNGLKYCSGMVEWQITKGQYINEETYISNSLRRTFEQNDERKTQITLYCCNYESAPERAKDPGVEFLGTVPIDLSAVDVDQFDNKLVKGRMIYNITYTLEVMMAAKEGVLCFKVLCGGNIIGSVEMEYAKE